MSNTVHFTLGDQFGQVLTNLAQEHIQYNYNLKKGLDAIEQGLIGIQRELVLDILSGKQIIAVEGDGVVVADWKDGVHDKIGYRKFNASKWTDQEVDRLVKSGEDLAETMDLWIDTIQNKRNGHFEIDFDSSALMQYIFNGDDSEIFMAIEDEMQPYRQLQLVLDAYIEKANTVLNCLKDLYQLSQTEECKGKPEWVVDIPPTLQVVMNIKTQIKQLVHITRFREGYEIVAEKLNHKELNPQDFYDGKIDGDNLLDSYLASQREIDEVEKDGIQATDISKNLNAYWLAPNGDAYGLNGDIANMLHNQIADMLIAQGIFELEDAEMGNADSEMQEQGWLKLHEGQVLGDHVYHEILITQEQKDALMKYCNVQPDYVLFMNHRMMRQTISKARMEMMNLKDLTNMLDIGMRKKDDIIKEEGKPSAKDVRDNPMFK